MYKILYSKTSKKVIHTVKVTEKFKALGYNKSLYDLAEVETLPEGKELYYENGEVVVKEE